MHDRVILLYVTIVFFTQYENRDNEQFSKRVFGKGNESKRI